MAIIDLDGYETGTTLMPNHTMSGTPATGSGRDGVGVSLRGSAGGSFLQRYFTSGSDTVYWHQGILVNGSAAWNTGLTGSYFFILLADSGAVSHLSADIDATGHLRLRRGGVGGTSIQTSTQVFPTSSAWLSMEVKATIHDTTGECVIKVNGVEWINFTGDTRNAGTSTRPDMIQLGAGNPGFWCDDFLMNDTTGAANNSWTSEVSIVGIRPAGNGANSALVGSDADSVNNYLLVDDPIPFNTTDYVGSVTNGALDTYDMNTIAKTGTVLAVQQLTYAAKSDATGKSFKHVMRSATPALVKSGVIPLSTTYALYAGPVWTTDGDGTAWTVAKVNAHEFGFEVA